MEYKYDGVGRLLGRKDADGEQVFVQAGWSIMTEQDTEGRRTYYTGSSSQSNNGGEANFFLFNHRGDTVLITDQTGEVSNELYYEAYGKVTNQSGTPINLTAETTPNLFVGAYGIRYDVKTELSYMRFRWYSQIYSRFIDRDKILDLNMFSYVNNTPVNQIDYYGLYGRGDFTHSTFEEIEEYNSHRTFDDIWIIGHAIERDLMIWAGTHATGVDLSLNAGAALMGNGYTVGAGLQVLTDQSGKFNIFFYSQKGNLVGTGVSIGPSLSVFYVNNYQKDNYIGRSNSVTAQYGYVGGGFFWGEGKNSPCGGNVSANYIPGIAGSKTDQFFISYDQAVSYLDLLFKPRPVFSSINGTNFIDPQFKYQFIDPQFKDRFKEMMDRYYRWAFENIFWFQNN